MGGALRKVIDSHDFGKDFNHFWKWLQFVRIIKLVKDLYPIGSMYGIFNNIYHKDQPNVGKYIIHGWYGYEQSFIIIYPYNTCIQIWKISPGCRPWHEHEG